MNFSGGVPGMPADVSASPPPLSRYTISGLATNASAAPLVGASVEVYETLSGMFRGSTTTDASGLYSVDITSPDALDANGNPLTFFAVAYSSDGTLGGVTVNTLVGVPT